jgi:hypothetical protein
MTVMDWLTCCEITFKKIHFPWGEVVKLLSHEPSFVPEVSAILMSRNYSVIRIGGARHKNLWLIPDFVQLDSRSALSYDSSAR